MTDTFEWQGRVGETWAEEWRRTDRALAPVNAALVEAGRASGAPADRILDIGCGAGATSLALGAAFPQARVLGIDLSEALVGVAAERARDLPRLRFAVADAAKFGDPDHRPDLLVSRHGVMFFDDPVSAFSSLRASARPGARLVFSCFRSVAENEWATAIAAALPQSSSSRTGEQLLGPGPFAFADPDRAHAILSRAGWQAGPPKPFDFDYVAGQGGDPVADAMAFFARIGPAARAIRELAPPARDDFLARLEALLRQRSGHGKVAFKAAAWIWTAQAQENRP